MSPIKILLADDHTLVRAGLRALLQSLEGVSVIGEAGNGQEALDALDSLEPDLILMDIAMPRSNGLEAACRILKKRPGLGIIMLSMHANEEYVREALQVGARGYLLKGAEPPELDFAIKSVMRGDTYLTPAISKQVVSSFIDSTKDGRTDSGALTGRQREILQLIAEGHSTKEIAFQLDISVKTVESHRAELMNRLNIHDVAGLVRHAIRIGLVPADS